MKIKSTIVLIMVWVGLLLSSPAALSTTVTDTLEDIGSDGTAVTDRLIDGVIVTISNASGVNMEARTYFNDTFVAFNGAAGNNDPLNPRNVSGSRFISTSGFGVGINKAQPIIFDFSKPVMGFGLTSLDLLEIGVSQTDFVTLEALDSTGFVIDSHTRIGPQATSGIDLDWFVSSSSADILQARLLSSNLGTADGYGIDDLVVQSDNQNLTTKQLYSVDVDTDELVQINSITGAVSVIGSLGMDASDIDLTLTSNGQLFGLNATLTSGVDLWTINRTTGAANTIAKVTGIIYAEGLGHSGNNLNIGYSSGSNYTFSDRFADLSTTGEISNSMSFTVSDTGDLLDFDALSVGLGDIPFYAADAKHPISSNETRLLVVNPDAPIAMAIGKYNFNEVATNDLMALGSDIFGIDHVNSVLHRIDPITGLVDATISLDRNGYYFGLAAPVPPPRPNICSLDIDSNSEYDALTDGILVIRYLFGFRDPALCDGAVDPDYIHNCKEIEAYLQKLMP